MLHPAQLVSRQCTSSAVPETITSGVKKNVTNIEQPRGEAEIEHSSLLSSCCLCWEHQEATVLFEKWNERNILDSKWLGEKNLHFFLDLLSHFQLNYRLTIKSLNKISVLNHIFRKITIYMRSHICVTQYDIVQFWIYCWIIWGKLLKSLPSETSNYELEVSTEIFSTKNDQLTFS